MFVPMRTFQAAVRLIDGIAELAEPSAFPRYVLPELSRLIGCDIATYNEIGPTQAQVRYVDFPGGQLDPAIGDVFAAYVHQHPVVNHYRATGDGSPAKISDFISRSQFHRLGLYAEFFRQIPVEHQLAITLTDPTSTVTGIAFNRAVHDFNDQDRAVLAALRRPLVLGLIRLRAKACAHAALLATSVDRTLELTDRELRVLELVAAGRTNVAIARIFDISPRTVAKHLEHIYGKLDVTNRAAAVARIRGQPRQADIELSLDQTTKGAR
jgi:DNA-binding CsgD family transcriptional regulator